MKLTVQELRIGNIIRHNVKDDETGGFCEPNEDVISADDMNIFLITDQLEQAEPVKLTEEWLLKFGLGGYSSTKIPGGYRITIPIIQVILETFTVTQPKYVHQLQNLCFALTGDELTLNTESKHP